MRSRGAAFVALLAAAPAWAAQCNDTVDNDGDGLVDWQLDLGCTKQDDDSEGGVPTGTIENGWTVFEPSADTRIVYVDASRPNDNGDGLSPATAKQTIWGGLNLMRSGRPDWLLLRRGDTWSGEYELPGTGGRSKSEPWVIASYGSSLERPVVGSFTKWGAPRLQHVAIVDIHYAEQSFSFSSSDDILLEGCFVQRGGAFQGVAGAPNTDMRLRRILSKNAFFAQYNEGLEIRESIVDRPTDEHGMYIARSGNLDVVTSRNLVLMDHPAGDAIMQRPGGRAEYNVVVGADWQGLNIGACHDGDPGQVECFEPAPVSEVLGNLAMDGLSLGGGYRIDESYIQPGIRVAHNISIHASGNGLLRDTLFEGNFFYNSKATTWFLSPPAQPNVIWRNNTFYNDQGQPVVEGEDLANPFTAEGNRFYSNAPADQWFRTSYGVSTFAQWVARTGETGTGGPITFPRPPSTVTLGNYHGELGGTPTREAFFTEAMKQKRFDWKPEYGADAVIAWFRAGFGLAPIGGGDSLPPARPRGLRIR